MLIIISLTLLPLPKESRLVGTFPLSSLLTLTAQRSPSRTPRRFECPLLTKECPRGFINK